MDISALLNKSLVPAWTVFIFIFGLCVGSFLNVCIWRIPRSESIVSPPSHCPKCDHELSWYENIPLLSWICLRGRCRKCMNPITSRYFWVELLTGLLFLGVWFRIISFNLRFPVFVGLLVGSLVVTILALLTAFIDYEHYIIPNKITYPTLIYGLAMAPVVPALWLTDSRWKALSFSCASVMVCTIILSGFAVLGKKIFKKDALGWGDVKYIAALAAVLGPIACFFTLLSGSIIGAVSGLLLIAFKRKKFKSPIPFGVCLALGTYLWIICGKEALTAYLRFSKELAERIAN